MVLSNVARVSAILIRSRGLEIFTYLWCVLVGSLIAGRGLPQILPTAGAILTTLSIVLCVYIYNDITDTEMDKLNPKKSKRPLPSGKVSAREAMTFVYVTGLAAMFLAALVKLEIFLICIIWLALFLAYSEPQIRLKKKLISKAGTPPIGLFLSFIMGAVANGLVSTTAVFAGIFSALFLFFGFPAFRDTSDIEEDRIYGVKTLATILSWKQRMEMAILFVLAAMTLTPLTYVNFGFNMIFPIVVVAMGFLTLRFLLPLANRLEQVQYDRAFKCMSSYFFLVQISMVLGSLSIV